MIGLKAKTLETAPAYLLSCEVIAAKIWCEDGNCEETVWGLRVVLTNGETESLPDISTKQYEVEDLKKKLDDAFVNAHHLHDIIEDYINCLYGLPCNS